MTDMTELGITNRKIRKVSNKILKTMNELHDDGHGIEDIVLITLYIVGANIKKHGLHLNLDAPLETALPALVEGYRNQE